MRSKVSLVIGLALVMGVVLGVVVAPWIIQRSSSSVSAAPVVAAPIRMASAARGTRSAAGADRTGHARGRRAARAAHTA